MSDEDRPVQHRDRLWAPWRMRYVGGGARTGACVFCAHTTADNDPEALVLFRSAKLIGVLNLYPYTVGHLMLVPTEHVAGPEDAHPAALTDMMAYLPPCLRALRRALNCEGFNVGFNLGSAAGAGITEHLHLHIVPRWSGDANFMPILASTAVMPELLSVTYAKLRAELEREIKDAFADVAPSSVVVAIIEPRGGSVVVRHQDDQLALPSVTPGEDEAVWRAVMAYARTLSDQTELLGWVGPSRAEGGAGPRALGVIVEVGTNGITPPSENLEIATIDTVLPLLPAEQAAIVGRGQNLANALIRADRTGPT